MTKEPDSINAAPRGPRRVRAKVLLEWREPRSPSAGLRSLRRSPRDEFPTPSRYAPIWSVAWVLVVAAFLFVEARLHGLSPPGSYWVGAGLLAWPYVWLIGFRLPVALWRSRVFITDRGFQTWPLYLKRYGGRFERMEEFWFEVDGRSHDPILCLRRRDGTVLEFTVPPSVAIEQLRHLILSNGVRTALDEHRGTP